MNLISVFICNFYLHHDSAHVIFAGTEIVGRNRSITERFNRMPHYKSAKKRVRQQEKHRLYNKSNKSRMRTSIKKVLEAENKETAEANINHAMSLIDRMVKKGIIHKNNAARKKSRLAHHITGMKAE